MQLQHLAGQTASLLKVVTPLGPNGSLLMRFGHFGHLSGQTQICRFRKSGFGPRGVQHDRHASIMSRLGRGVSQLPKTVRLAREVSHSSGDHHYRRRLAKIDFATRISAAVSVGSKSIIGAGNPRVAVRNHRVALSNTKAVVSNPWVSVSNPWPTLVLNPLRPQRRCVLQNPS